MCNCDRCGQKTNVTTMSWFNTNTICMKCSDDEHKHPDFKKAQYAETEALNQGNTNFRGIGYTAQHWH